MYLYINVLVISLDHTFQEALDLAGVRQSRRLGQYSVSPAISKMPSVCSDIIQSLCKVTCQQRISLPKLMQHHVLGYCLALYRYEIFENVICVKQSVLIY